jgi:uncharacterized phage protein (TIGR02218 family)
MRSLALELSARLASGATTFAHVWRLVRRDGAVYVFTDHDEPLVFDGLTAEPMAALKSGAIEKSLDLAVDTASLSGVLSSQALNEDELARGLWDGARIDIYRADWTAPSLRIHLFSGRLGEVRRGASAFEAELRGVQAMLNVPVGRVFSRYCDADLGDARCGMNTEVAAFRGTGVVAAVLSAASFRASGLAAFASGWFARGRLVWGAGGESQISAHGLVGDEAVVELLDATPNIAVGAAFVIYAGCDKRIETCREKFANALNFRGFPHMPGNDALLAGPAQGARLDGSSRFT